MYDTAKIWERDIQRHLIKLYQSITALQKEYQQA